MNVFIIHRGRDNKVVFKLKKYIESKTSFANMLVLTSNKKIWKPEAKKLIKKADIVLFLVGRDSSTNGNIGWEIETCLNKNKVIFCVDLYQYDNLGEDFDLTSLPVSKEYIEHYPLHPKLKEKNPFNQEIQFSNLVKKLPSVNDFIDIVEKHVIGDYEIFNREISGLDNQTLLEQYKIYLNTSETLVARRQAISSFYITVNGALITIASVASPFINNTIAMLIIIIAISIFGFSLCFFWRQILDSYGTLNSSKMKVINLLEKKLPANLFEKEWEILVDKLNNKKYISFTASEKKIPLVFSVIYLLAFIASIVTLLIILL